MPRPVIEVQVNNAAVGEIHRAQEPSLHLFRYRPEVPPAMAVSLLMPPENPEYDAGSPGALHPVFAMNLPEGELRRILTSRFAQQLGGVFDDYALLGLVGHSQIGRLRTIPTDAGIVAPPAPLNIRGLLQETNTHAIFDRLLEQYGASAGVSGVQPKILVRDEQAKAAEPISRLTFPESTHIIKTFDPARFPDLALNEHLCLLVAKESGLDAATSEVSSDGGLLAVARFDLLPEGKHLGFEDFCALSAKQPDDKYSGSYEDLAQLLTRFVTPASNTVAELRKFFQTLVLSVALRNGDAHLKNFGLLYADAAKGPVRLAPAFDIVTTTPYLSRDRMALSFGGKNHWPSAKGLIEFGIRHCFLPPADARGVVQQVIAAVAAIKPRLAEIRNGAVRLAMEEAWTYGLELDPPPSLRMARRAA
jgi:serine/threonine-protein kinase HipA